MKTLTWICCATCFFIGAVLVAWLTGNDVAAKTLVIPNTFCSGLVFGWLARDWAERKRANSQKDSESD